MPRRAFIRKEYQPHGTPDHPGRREVYQGLGRTFRRRAFHRHPGTENHFTIPASAVLDPFRIEKALTIKFFVHDPLTSILSPATRATSPARPRNTWHRRASRTRAASTPRPSSTSLIPSASPRIPTPASTRSTPMRAGGTVAAPPTSTAPRTPATRHASKADPSQPPHRRDPADDAAGGLTFSPCAVMLFPL